jgi:hypothetical protein
MAIKFDDYMAKLPEERRRAIEERAAELIAEEATSRRSRQARERSDTDTAPEAGSRPVPKGAPMTDAELRIVAFLEASAAARPAEFPDWMLALLEGDRPEEMGPELITAASLLYARRLHPGIGLDAAFALMAGYADDPARLAEISDRFAAFRLACAFERLKRAGRLEDVYIDDPFDPDGEVSVKLTEARWQAANRESPPGDAPPDRN